MKLVLKRRKSSYHSLALWEHDDCHRILERAKSEFKKANPHKKGSSGL